MHVARLSSVLKLRAVVPEDAEVACQVFDAHDPDEPQDPDVTRHRWTVNTPDSVRERFLIEQCDLAANRDRLLAKRDDSRRAMREQGIALGTQASDDDPELVQKLYRLNAETTLDVPTTVPHSTWSLEEFKMWGASPEFRSDRSWI